MVKVYKNFFNNPEMINKILDKKIVKDNIRSDLKVFYINIDEETRAYINTQLGVNIGSKVPMKITSKDIKEHADIRFDTKESDDTYIIYISDPGDTKLLIDNQTYPLKKNTAFKFGSDVVHSTVDTNISRIMLGPFNREGVMMGGEPVSHECLPHHWGLWPVCFPTMEEWHNYLNQKKPKGVVYCRGCPG